MGDDTDLWADHAFKVSFRPGNAELAAARRRFEAWLETNSLRGDDAVEMAVVFSELASNAVEAHDGAPGSVGAQAWRDDGDVFLEVTNVSPNNEAVVDRWDLEDPLRGGGRGLMIVRAFTDVVDVAAGDHTVTVRCRRHLGNG